MPFARERAALKLAALRWRSLPIARAQTCPRKAEGMPCHQRSRVFVSVMAVFQSPRICRHARRDSSTSFSLLDRLVFVFSESVDLRFSASAKDSIIALYSFRCLRSSRFDFGGSHDGRVRVRNFSFSLLAGSGSIRGLPFCTGGSVHVVDLECLRAGRGGEVDDRPGHCVSSELRRLISA